MAIQTALDSINQNAGSPFGFKNRIINGAMVIDQRNAGANSTSTGAYTVDRWGYYASQSSKGTWGQNLGGVTPPTGFKNYLGFSSSSAYTVVSGDYFDFAQGIEGYNIADLDWGSSTAKSVTLSFWVRSSLTGTFSLAVRNGNNDYVYIATYTINSSNTWEYKTVTVPGPTAGSWNTTSGNGVSILFVLGAGSTYTSSTTNSWQSSSAIFGTGTTSVVGTNGATFYVTGVQLEKGNQATSFDYRPYGTEVQLCGRYYQQFDMASSTSPLTLARFMFSSNGYLGSLMFPIVMRGTPSGSITTNQLHKPGIIYDTISTLTINPITSKFATISTTPSTNSTDCNVLWLSNGIIKLDAEF